MEKKSPPRYVVSIVKSDYSKITYFTFLCKWRFDNLQQYDKIEFFIKYRYFFLQKNETLFTKFDPIVGNCVLYIAYTYVHVEVEVLKKSSDQWQPYLMSQTWQLNKKGKAC